MSGDAGGSALWDALVVGGGPAGAITALELARSGARVAVVERSEMPRPKPCGDCLSAAATALLRELGLLDRVLALGPARLTGWRIVSPAGHACEGRFPPDPGAALAVERRDLDATLLGAAEAAGAVLVSGRGVDVERSAAGRVIGARMVDDAGRSRDLRARVVVGADGLRSVVSRRLGLVRRRPRLRKVSITAHGAGPVGDLDAGEMHVLDGGCIGIAPVGGGRFNLTLVVADRHAADLGRLGPKRFLDRWLRRAPAVGDRVDIDALDGPFLASGPFDWPTRRVTAPGAALVGDAAGYYDPFTGQGIYRALAGGRLLAATLTPALAGDDVDIDRSLRSYARAHRRLTAPTRRLQRVIEAVLSRPAMADLALGRLAAAGPAIDRIVAVTGDLRPPRSLLSPAVLSSLVIPPRTPELS